MSPFDTTIHFKLFGYYWNAGYKKKGIVSMGGWKRVWRFYFCAPIKAIKTPEGLG